MNPDIELQNVEATIPLMRSLSTQSEDEYELKSVETPFGTVVVAKQGADFNPSKPAIITYHDIGLNHVSNFQAFFNYMDMRLLLKSFTVFHINAPGQEENSPKLPSGFVYPSMDQLAEQVEMVCKFFGIKNFIGIGVGSGANILARFALRHHGYVDGLFLVNATASQSSWTEWFYQKLNVYYLNSSSTSDSFPQSITDYLMWHHFGKITEDRNRDLIEAHRAYFSGKSITGRNLALFIDSYIKRTDLGLVRGDKTKTFKFPVLLISGTQSPHAEETVNMNSRLDPTNSTWITLSDCAMVLEEQPGKVEEALRLFIQGLGYALAAYERRRSSLRKASLLNSTSFEDDGMKEFESFEKIRKHSVDLTTAIKEEREHQQPALVHIVENPIAQS